MRRNFVREKKIFCGEKYLEVDIVPVTNIPQTGRKKKKESSQKQKNLNEKNSRRRFVQTANTNFDEGDLHLSLTYNERHLPHTLKDAEKEVHNFLNKVKRKMRKDAGLELRYMLVTEYTPENVQEERENEKDPETDGQGDRNEKVVRIHHHIILNKGISRDDLELMWSHTKINWKKAQDPEYRKETDSLGYANCDRLQPGENGIEALVKYINKRKKGCKKWSCSRNLKKPVIRKNDHRFSFRKIRKLAETPEDREYWRNLYKGYEPVSINFQYNENTGWSIYLKLKNHAGRKPGRKYESREKREKHGKRREMNGNDSGADRCGRA